jgi:hypothetical protein
MLRISLKARIADINDKKISNVQKDTEIKALQEKFTAPAPTASWGSNIADRSSALFPGEGG